MSDVSAEQQLIQVLQQICWETVILTVHGATRLLRLLRATTATCNLHSTTCNLHSATCTVNTSVVTALWGDTVYTEQPAYCGY